MLIPHLLPRVKQRDELSRERILPDVSISFGTVTRRTSPSQVLECRTAANRERKAMVAVEDSVATKLRIPAILAMVSRPATDA